LDNCIDSYRTRSDSYLKKCLNASSKCFREFCKLLP
jgi:hypothetical protein